MKVATWNVNGIRARSSQVISWIDREEPDVICLQEIKASRDKVPEPLVDIAGYHSYWHGHGGYSGVALLMRTKRFPDVPVFTHPHFDLETRIAVTEISGVVYGSMYVPNGGKGIEPKLVFLRELEAWIGTLVAAGKRVVLCGDYNVSRAPIDVHPTLRNDAVGQTKLERELIDAVFAHGLVDVGRYCDPDNDRLFTWWAPWRNMRERNIGWRLDLIAASADLVHGPVTCKVYRDVGTSDHGPVIAHIAD